MVVKEVVIVIGAKVSIVNDCNGWFKPTLEAWLLMTYYNLLSEQANWGKNRSVFGGQDWAWQGIPEHHRFIPYLCRSDWGNENVLFSLTHTSLLQLTAASNPRPSRSMPPSWCQSCSGSALKASISSLYVMKKEDSVLATQDHENWKQRIQLWLHQNKGQGGALAKPTCL